MSFIIDTMSYCGNKIIGFMCSCYEFLTGTAQKSNEVGQDRIGKAAQDASYISIHNDMNAKYTKNYNMEDHSIKGKSDYWIVNFFNNLKKSF